MASALHRCLLLCARVPISAPSRERGGDECQFASLGLVAGQVIQPLMCNLIEERSVEKIKTNHPVHQDCPSGNSSRNRDTFLRGTGGPGEEVGWRVIFKSRKGTKHSSWEEELTFSRAGGLSLLHVPSKAYSSLSACMGTKSKADPMTSSSTVLPNCSQTRMDKI